MKKAAFAFLLGVLAILSNSCTKDSDGPDSSFSAKIEGNSWSASLVAATHQTFLNTTTITATNSSLTEQVVLSFRGSGTGTFAVNDDYNICSAIVGSYNFSSLYLDDPSGSIVITKYDASNKLISGTFSFEGEDLDGYVYSVTEGKFENVTLTVL